LNLHRGRTFAYLSEYDDGVKFLEAFFPGSGKKSNSFFIILGAKDFIGGDFGMLACLNTSCQALGRRSSAKTAKREIFMKCLEKIRVVVG
jgi:hypothetical protein